MLDEATLRSGLERLRVRLEEDITSRSEDEPAIAADLRQRYEAARAAKRTGLAFELWHHQNALIKRNITLFMGSCE